MRARTHADPFPLGAIIMQVVNKDDRNVKKQHARKKANLKKCKDLYDAVMDFNEVIAVSSAVKVANVLSVIDEMSVGSGKGVRTPAKALGRKDEKDPPAPNVSADSKGRGKPIRRRSSSSVSAKIPPSQPPLEGKLDSVKTMFVDVVDYLKEKTDDEKGLNEAERQQAVSQAKAAEMAALRTDIEILKESKAAGVIDEDEFKVEFVSLMAKRRKLMAQK